MSSRDSTSLFATAHHEAGHAIAACRLGLAINYVALVDHFVPDAGVTELLDQTDPTRREAAERKAIQALAGRAAEERASGRPSTGSHHDLECATKVMTPFVAPPETIDDALGSLNDRATQLIDDEWRFVEALAAKLLNLEARPELARGAGEMSGEEVQQFLRELGFFGEGQAS